MPLTNISIKNFRCFESIDISLSPGVNFFYGANGSGKTSILESVFIFSSGKSFKSSNLVSLINQNSEKFLLKGLDAKKGYIVEVEKTKDKPISILLNNKKTVTSKLIKEFPCTPIHNNTFSFTNASPDFRRKLLDRSIFIAEDNFSSNWFSYYRALKQRNSMLKNNRISDIYAWNKMLVEEGTKLDNYRKDFFDKTIEEFHTLLEILKPYNVFDFFDVINISFFQGWDNENSLLEILEENQQIDIRRIILGVFGFFCHLLSQLFHVELFKVFKITRYFTTKTIIYTGKDNLVFIVFKELFKEIENPIIQLRSYVIYY